MSVTLAVYYIADDHSTKWLAPEGFVQQFQDDNDGYGPCPTNQNPWEMNVSNDHWFQIMNLLGVETDYCGSWNDGSLQEVQEKVTFTLTSLKTMPELDNGVDNDELGPTAKLITSALGCSSSQVVSYPLPAGYFTERLTQILDILNAAIKFEGTVVWS